MDLKSISRATVDAMSDNELRQWFTQYIDMRDKEESLANAKKAFDWAKFLSKDKLRPQLCVSTMYKTAGFGWLRYATDMFSLVAKANCEGPKDEEIAAKFEAMPEELKPNVKDDDFVVRWDAKGNEYIRDFWQGDLNGNIVRAVEKVLKDGKSFTKVAHLSVNKVRNALKRLNNLFETGGRDCKGKKYQNYGLVAIPLWEMDEDDNVVVRHLFLNEDAANKLLYLMDKFGTNVVKFDAPNRGLYLENGDWMGIIMPTTAISDAELDEKNKVNVENYYYWEGDKENGTI